MLCGSVFYSRHFANCILVDVFCWYNSSQVAVLVCILALILSSVYFHLNTLLRFVHKLRCFVGLHFWCFVVIVNQCRCFSFCILVEVIDRPCNLLSSDKPIDRGVAWNRSGHGRVRYTQCHRGCLQGLPVLERCACKGQRIISEQKNTRQAVATNVIVELCNYCTYAYTWEGM